MKKISVLILLAAGLSLVGACVKVDGGLGKGLVDKSLLYDTYTEEFPLEQLQMKHAAGLSGYSDAHLTIGAIRDDTFGLTTRSAAFTLIPALDTLDLGKNPTAVSFDIYFEADTISCASDGEKGILQNIHVYELTKPLDKTAPPAMTPVEYGTERITDGLPVYGGEGALNFNFTKDFAQKYVDRIAALGPVLKERSDDENAIDLYDDYVKALPGIYITTDVPQGNGGRINLFQFSCLSVVNKYYRRNSNVAILKVHSEWDGVQKDSSFVFLPGEPEFSDEATALRNNSKFYQYCFNHTTHSTVEGAPAGQLLVEGGSGLKPVVSARELQEKTRAAISARGGNPDKAIIVKATIVLPFEMPADYEDLKYFPSILSPTICTEMTGDETEDGTPILTYAGLTDASVATEDQGEIDRSILAYTPDITYHLQELLHREDLDTATDADIWLLTIHTQQVADADGSLYDNSYYQNLLYANYYNSIYGGGYGYGGMYGGYGGGYGYNNYYNYMMLAQMMAASTQQTYTTTTELDKDRYYRAVLNGPASPAERKPVFRVTYALSQQ